MKKFLLALLFLNSFISYWVQVDDDGNEIVSSEKKDYQIKFQSQNSYIPSLRIF